MHTYLLTCSVTGKRYVGATIQPMERRLADHSRAARTGRKYLICEAIRQHGMGSFSVEILKTAKTYDELMLTEIEAIREYGTLDPAGYNMTTGGKGTPDRRVLESTKLAIAAKATGRHPTDEVRQKISQSLKGRQSPTLGMKFDKAWNTGMKMSPEYCETLRKAHAGKASYNSRQIEVHGVVYSSVKEATTKTGLSRTQLMYRLETGRGIRFLSDPPKCAPSFHHEAKKIELFGVEYQSIAEAIRATGIPRHKINTEIQKGHARFL